MKRKTFIALGIFSIALLTFSLTSSRGDGLSVILESGDGRKLPGVCDLATQYCSEQEGAPGDHLIVSKVRTSSFLADARDPLRYGPLSLLDNNPDTTWSEGVDGEGLGEWVEVNFAGPEKIHSIEVWGGFFSRDYLFANNRLREFELWVDGEILRRVVLPDDGKPVEVQLPTNKALESLRIVIIDVHDGQRWDDTCISDIVFYRDGTQLSLSVMDGAHFPPGGSAPSAVQVYNARDRVAVQRGEFKHQDGGSSARVQYLARIFAEQELRYNDRGQLLNRKESLSIQSEGNVTEWTFTYDNEGRIETSREERNVEEPYHLKTAVYEYDAGLLKTIQYSAAGDDSEQVFSYGSYQIASDSGSGATGQFSQGIISKTLLAWDETRDSQGRVLNRQEYDYDARGRLEKEVVNAHDRSKRRIRRHFYFSDGPRSETYWGRNGHDLVRYGYNAGGRLVRELGHDNRKSPVLKGIISYRYNEEGNISRVYEYDIYLRGPQTGSYTALADAYGLFVSGADLPAGWTVTSERNQEGAITRKVVRDRSNVIEQVLVYEY